MVDSTTGRRRYPRLLPGAFCGGVADGGEGLFGADFLQLVKLLQGRAGEGAHGCEEAVASLLVLEYSVAFGVCQGEVCKTEEARVADEDRGVMVEELEVGGQFGAVEAIDKALPRLVTLRADVDGHIQRLRCLDVRGECGGLARFHGIVLEVPVAVRDDVDGLHALCCEALQLCDRVFFAVAVAVKPCSHRDGAAVEDEADDGFQRREGGVGRLFIANAAALDELTAQELIEGIGVLRLGNSLRDIGAKEGSPRLRRLFGGAARTDGEGVVGSDDVALRGVALGSKSKTTRLMC